MKKQKQRLAYVLTGVLSVGAIGGFGLTNAYAATGTEQPVKVSMYSNLDQETQEEVKGILDQVQAGTITKEEVQEQLAELGVEHPANGKRGFGGTLSQLDEETQEKVRGIFEQVKAGTITEEEAQEQLAELGVEHPANGKRGFGGTLSQLDEETQEKVRGIFEQVKAGTITEEEAQEQLAELGVEHPANGKRGFGGTLSQLDEETQEKVKEIVEQMRAGTITKEEAAKQMAELGIDSPIKGDKQSAATEEEASL